MRCIESYDMLFMRIFLMALIILGIVGCTNIANERLYNNDTEIAAYGKSSWIPISKFQDGRIVFYDPYKTFYFQNSYSNTVSTPVSIPLKDTQVNANLIYKLNCEDKSGIVESTLGGKALGRLISSPEKSVNADLINKLCGINVYGSIYKYLSADTKTQNVFYFTNSGIEQNKENQNILKVGLLVYRSEDKKQFKRQIEFNCVSNQFKDIDGTIWKPFQRKSPVDILKYRLCPNGHPDQTYPYYTDIADPQALNREVEQNISKSQTKQIIKHDNKTASPKTKASSNTSSVPDFGKTSELNEAPSKKCSRLGLSPGSDDFKTCMDYLK